MLKNIKFKSIKEVLALPKSRYFWVSVRDGSFETGDSQSFFSKDVFDDNLTFDISNNKMLVSVGLNGSIKNITIHRGYHRAYFSWPGSWIYKDFTKAGPLSFSISIGTETYDLSKINWPYKTSLLDNIFPVTEFYGETLNITLITIPPISEDGKQRLRGVIYGAFLENTSNQVLKGKVFLPVIIPRLQDGISSTEVCTELADYKQKEMEIPFELTPGQNMWVPVVISPAGETVIDEIDSKGSLYWINSTWSYFKGIIGKLTMPEDKYAEEFLQRAIHQCIECIGIDGDGKVTGSSLGTYPSAPEVCMKDLFYSYMPFAMLEPEFFKDGILWFSDNSIGIRGNKYKGGVSHSLGITLTPVVMAGLYYSNTGDREFFIENKELKSKMVDILEQVVNSRKFEDVWLFPSDWVSDGRSRGDYHTGSNLLAWYSFISLARIMDEVYSDYASAEYYSNTAGRIREALESRCVIDGPFGKQYIEGVNHDGTIPKMIHDGEESDTTLMPVYGFLGYDNPEYRNYMNFTVSEHNHYYSAKTKGVDWTDEETYCYPSTFTSYISGFANVTDAETMNGKEGYMTEVRRLTDVDGSVWWWPYSVPGQRMTKPDEVEYGKVNRFCSKCGWASGTFAALFISEILGIKYDAPQKTLYFRPFSPSSSFSWEDFRTGKSTFSTSFSRQQGMVEISVANKNEYSIVLNIEIPLDRDKTIKNVSINGKEIKSAFEKGWFLDNATIKINDKLLGRGKKGYFNI